MAELNSHVLSQCSFQSGIPQPAAPLSPGYMLEMQIRSPHPRHTESETIIIILCLSIKKKHINTDRLSVMILRSNE